MEAEAFPSWWATTLIMSICGSLLMCVFVCTYVNELVLTSVFLGMCVTWTGLWIAVLIFYWRSPAGGGNAFALYAGTSAFASAVAFGTLLSTSWPHLPRWPARACQSYSRRSEKLLNKSCKHLLHVTSFSQYFVCQSSCHLFPSPLTLKSLSI